MREPLFAMGLVVVMGDFKHLNLFHSQCYAVVMVRECKKALNAHELQGSTIPLGLVPFSKS